VGIRFLVLLIFVFVFELFFLSKELRFKSQEISVEKTDIEFISSKTYDIDTKRVNSVLICDKIQQKKSKKIFFNPIATLYDDNITKTVFSKSAILEDKTKILTLKDNINIIYLDKRLYCNSLDYNISNSCVIDSSPFILKSKNLLAKGEHLYFDTKNSIIKAKNINYEIFIKE